MAQKVHWTQDPRFSHLRNPPAWYHRYKGPFSTPRPSSRMEKQTAEEQRRSWQSERTFNAGANKKDHFDLKCCEATFWPCGAYSRTSWRLKASLSGRDALDVPYQSSCNPDCVQFALCLPFYGCFIAKLQNTVRSFYDIAGKDTEDWCDGCCCPCVTLPRSEREILLRERQHRDLKAIYGDSDEARSPYKPLTPMVMDDGTKSIHTGESLRSSNDRTLPTIREDSSELSAAEFAPSGITIVEPLEKLDPVTSKPEKSEAKPFPLLQYLNRMWYLVPASKEKKPPVTKETPGTGSIEESNTEASATSTGSSCPPVDSRTPQKSKFREHLPKEDEASIKNLPVIKVTQYSDAEGAAPEINTQKPGSDEESSVEAAQRSSPPSSNVAINAPVRSVSEGSSGAQEEVTAPTTPQSHPVVTHESDEPSPTQPSRSSHTEPQLSIELKNTPLSLEMYVEPLPKVQRGIPHDLDDDHRRG